MKIGLFELFLESFIQVFVFKRPQSEEYDQNWPLKSLCRELEHFSGKQIPFSAFVNVLLGIWYVAEAELLLKKAFVVNF